MTNTELIRQEIERQMSLWWEKLPDADKDTTTWTQDEVKALGEYMAYESLLDFIDSLQQEQPEVDLEKEYTEFVVSDPVYSKLVNGIVGKSIARHFYELGLNARKEE